MQSDLHSFVPPSLSFFTTLPKPSTLIYTISPPQITTTETTTPTPAPSSTTSSSNISRNATIGVVVGTVISAILAAAALLYSYRCYRRRNRMAAGKKGTDDGTQSETQMAQELITQHNAHELGTIFNVCELEGDNGEVFAADAARAGNSKGVQEIEPEGRRENKKMKIVEPLPDGHFAGQKKREQENKAASESEEDDKAGGLQPAYASSLTTGSNREEEKSIPTNSASSSTPIQPINPRKTTTSSHDTGIIAAPLFPPPIPPKLESLATIKEEGG
ncbi:uncharacterized protein BP5553_01156 [Venustampulla echinocandica]|uniref:Uncharacterized protein n=1 Tax=Venustampulla echinocandica TaxID=2656787 RepID=A0A370U084_9HELO|nr:uncharacterized protein BP5553_01156 [Venustampulla echinocandica]RDL41177.1 hypothetical protein BP5553_01156 [Venustampulla echinocandica]